MSDDIRGSVSTWLLDLKAEPDHAAQELWNRYFAQLVSVARRHLHGLGREADEEDVALSALKSAFLGVQQNRFPDLTDRTGLWPLLVTITTRKAINEVRRRGAKKRGAVIGATLENLQEVAGAEPSPDFAARVTEELDLLVTQLKDPAMRVVAQRKLEGFSNEEIAAELGVSSRTIVRKLALVRQEWAVAHSLK